MTSRRVPRWSELRPFLRFEKPDLHVRRRRLAAAQTLWDVRRVARRTTPAAAFDYVDGAAEAEISMRRARRAFAQVTFSPRVFRDVASVDTGTTILGRPADLPLVFGPTGFTRMMHHEGERAVARSAERHGIPYALSTMGTTSIEEVAEAAPGGRRFFQLYVWKDRSRSEALIRRAADAGYDTLVVTVDTPVAGLRLRDIRNGMTIPPSLTPRTVLDAAWRPAWWLNLFTTEPLSFASLSHWSGTVQQLANQMFDPTASFDDLAWIRGQWPGKLVLKGLQSVEDARAAAEAGCDGIVLSNHGGRQLDRAPVPLELLPAVAAELGDRMEIFVDTGVMSGGDIAAAVGLGATAVWVGRAYLYGLMAGGEAGVDRVAEILGSELSRTMRLMGCSRLSELRDHRVALGAVPAACTTA